MEGTVKVRTTPANPANNSRTSQNAVKPKFAEPGKAEVRSKGLSSTGVDNERQRLRRISLDDQGEAEAEAEAEGVAVSVVSRALFSGA
jgi:hypothetical protein